MNKKVKILVDADACPVKEEIITISREYSVGAIFFCSLAHNLERSGPIKVVYLDKEKESVDFAIVNAASKGDIIVTQDYGLASICLGKGAFAVSPRGKIFVSRNIDSLLLKRHLEGKIRRAGGKTKGPNAMNEKDKQNFVRSLEKLLRESLANKSDLHETND